MQLEEDCQAVSLNENLEINVTQKPLHSSDNKKHCLYKQGAKPKCLIQWLEMK